MIIDALANAAGYFALHPRFETAFQFLNGCMKKMPEVGRYEIFGTELFAFVQRYDTKAAAEIAWEAHRKYIDIQCVISGRERIGYAPLHALISPGAYQAEKDNQAAADAADESFLFLGEGDFAILYPQDAHKPRCIAQTTCPVVKIAMKAALS